MKFKTKEWQPGDILMYIEHTQVVCTWLVIKARKASPEHPESTYFALVFKPGKLPERLSRVFMQDKPFFANFNDSDCYYKILEV